MPPRSRGPSRARCSRCTAGYCAPGSRCASAACASNRSSRCRPSSTRSSPGRAAASCQRSSVSINWLLAHHEGTRRLFLARARDGRALGYFLVTTKFHASASSDGFRNLTLGSIKDWMSFEPGELGEPDLLLLATRELCRDRAVDAIEVCLPDESAARALRRLGFLVKGDLKFLFKAAPQSPLAAAPLRERNQWWFRPADGDNLFF
ncbi:MAG: hypothetical protein IPJ19_18170 [Planctomycetes bacterium]|nr:hypothetical protein [Planctomycetota bacterium]